MKENEAGEHGRLQSIVIIIIVARQHDHEAEDSD